MGKKKVEVVQEEIIVEQKDAAKKAPSRKSAPKKPSVEPVENSVSPRAKKSVKIDTNKQIENAFIHGVEQCKETILKNLDYQQQYVIENNTNVNPEVVNGVIKAFDVVRQIVQTLRAELGE